ncbi:AAA family ATPase [Faunimonas sp. B44]|uniref:AAA family ATPase n=1 Tax=Faunimonas sp. B44 TaxID=3461493 RepID=UPI00404468C3
MQEAVEELPIELEVTAGATRQFVALRDHLQRELIGRSALVERLLTALLCGGHVLIEGLPGLAKTRAVKLLSGAVDASFARIQCTPDLIPADLTGTPIFRPDRGEFEFAAGPVFNSIVLVDEVNRAPPKVQSALLEAMAEGQVTAGGVTYPLPDPFMVVATQNPIEHEGTFPLPEAQLDRFLLHVIVNLPDPETELLILDLVEREGAGVPARGFHRISATDVRAARDAAARVHLAPALKDYIVRLVTATRRPGIPEISRLIEHAVSPRGTLALAAGAKAKAFLAGRDYALPEDVQELVADTLAHRMTLTWAATAEGETPREVVRHLIEAVRPL